jgi:hypothetical protein
MSNKDSIILNSKSFCIVQCNNISVSEKPLLVTNLFYMCFIAFF